MACTGIRVLQARPGRDQGQSRDPGHRAGAAAAAARRPLLDPTSGCPNACARTRSPTSGSRGWSAATGTGGSSRPSRCTSVVGWVSTPLWPADPRSPRSALGPARSMSTAWSGAISPADRRGGLRHLGPSGRRGGPAMTASTPAGRAAAIYPARSARRGPAPGRGFRRRLDLPVVRPDLRRPAPGRRPGRALSGAGSVMTATISDLRALVGGGLPPAPGRGPHRPDLGRDDLRRRFTVATSMGDTVLPHLVRDDHPGHRRLLHRHRLPLPRDPGHAGRPTPRCSLRLRRRAAAAHRRRPGCGYGPGLHDRDPTCAARCGVEPLEPRARGYHAWASGVAPARTPRCRDVRSSTGTSKRDVVKVNPFASWTDDDVAPLCRRNDVFDKPTDPGRLRLDRLRTVRPPTACRRGPRAGRWASRDKTECGLHI